MNPTLSLSPNPFTDSFSVSVNTLFSSTAILSITNSDGKIIRVAGWELTPGNNKMSFANMDHLLPGNYTVTIQFTDSQFNQSLTAKKV
jgi:methionine-rich copper-binding protein CopC